MYVIEELDRKNKSDWVQFVSNHPMSNIYHTLSFLESAEKIKSLTPKYLMVRKKGKLVAIFPIFTESNFLKSLRFFNNTFPSGPLIKGNDTECLKFLISYIEGYCSRSSIHTSKIRVSDLNFVKFSKLLNLLGYHESLRGCHVVVDLSHGYDAVRKKYSSSKRRYIKKSLNSNFSIEEMEQSDKSMIKFYNLYKTLILKRHNNKFFTFHFFKKLKENLGHNVQFLYLKQNNDYCGVFLNIIDEKNKSLVNLLGVLNNSSQKSRGFELMHDYSIRHACLLKLKKYDMGGSGSLISEGVLKFKSEFGGSILPYLSWEKQNSFLLIFCKFVFNNFSSSVFRILSGK